MAKVTATVFLLSLSLTLVLGSPLDTEDTVVAKLNARCATRDATSCLMLKLVTYMDRLLKKSSIAVGDSLTVTQTSPVVQEQSPLSRSLEVDGDSSEDTQLAQLVADKLWSFVRSRSIKWRAVPEADLELSATPDDQGTLRLGLNIRAARAIQTGSLKRTSYHDLRRGTQGSKEVKGASGGNLSRGGSYPSHCISIGQNSGNSIRLNEDRNLAIIVKGKSTASGAAIDTTVSGPALAMVKGASLEDLMFRCPLPAFPHMDTNTEPTAGDPSTSRGD